MHAEMVVTHSSEHQACTTSIKKYLLLDGDFLQRGMRFGVFSVQIQTISVVHKSRPMIPNMLIAKTSFLQLIHTAF